VAFAGDASSEMKFTDGDPINKVLVSDLDANGYDELYIINYQRRFRKLRQR